MSDTQAYRQPRFEPPPGSADLLLVRHGESAPARLDEPFPLVDGHGDPELDPVGHEQAELLAERLADDDIAAIYATTLRRTVETATPLAKRLGLDIRIEPDLREVHLGEWEGGSFRKHIADGHPIAVQMWAEQRWDVIPGAEPGEAFSERVTRGMNRIAQAHPDQTVVVVVHGGVIGQVLADAVGCRGFAFTGSANTGISRLVVTPDRWIVRSYNDTAHLGLGFTADS